MSLPFVYQMVLIAANQLGPAEALANRFRATGARVVVTKSPKSATTLVQDMKVDLVFISFMLQDHKLMDVLDRRGVPYIICATPASLTAFADGIDACSEHAGQPAITSRAHAGEVRNRPPAGVL